ncbi:hypothetical protein TNCV_2088761 [Trichonephila clavipes]|nr:hypothetical protein TNCV_2088761 [Trichonephila clavipes]
MEGLPYCNLYRSKFGDKKFGDQKWVLLGFKRPVPKFCFDAHPSTHPFGVVPRTRKLDCSGMEPGRLLQRESRFNLSSDENRVRVWRHCVNASILLLLYNDTPLPQLV